MKHFKKYPGTKITASEDIGFTNADVIRILKEHGIDTTKCQYELKAEGYERYGGGQHYVKKFTCPGNYLAYFAMCFHRSPNAELIDDWFGEEGFIELVEECPTVSEMEDHASCYWWGDGDDYIYYLKNLTTGEVLYDSGEEPEYYEDEDEWGED